MSFKTSATQDILNNSGIYFIKNQTTQKLYIGSTSSLVRRYKEHFNTLRRKQHHSAHLQASFNKYGLGVFEFGVIEVVDENNLIPQEQYWMDLLKLPLFLAHAKQNCVKLIRMIKPLVDLYLKSMQTLILNIEIELHF